MNGTTKRPTRVLIRELLPVHWSCRFTKVRETHADPPVGETRNDSLKRKTSRNDNDERRMTTHVSVNWSMTS